VEVESYHTYFVGEDLWGFSVWAHNSCHSNSAKSGKANHVYVIFDKTTGDVHKFGISSGKITKAGKSYRATSQVNNAAGGNYDSVVVRKFNNRADAFKWEDETVGFWRLLEHLLPGNKLPLGNYW
jgi:hypothetical protein